MSVFQKRRQHSGGFRKIRCAISSAGSPLNRPDRRQGDEHSHRAQPDVVAPYRAPPDDLRKVEAARHQEATSALKDVSARISNAMVTDKRAALTQRIDAQLANRRRTLRSASTAGESHDDQACDHPFDRCRAAQRSCRAGARARFSGENREPAAKSFPVASSQTGRRPDGRARPMIQFKS
jgi:hypothetical protein